MHDDVGIVIPGAHGHSPSPRHEDSLQDIIQSSSGIFVQLVLSPLSGTGK